MLTDLGTGLSAVIAIAIIIAILLINGAPRLLGWLMLAVAVIAIADGVIVVRSGGPGPSPTASTGPPLRSCS
jgi:hypothetical protein